MDYRELLKKVIKSSYDFKVAFTELESNELKVVTGELQKQDDLEMAKLMRVRGCKYSFDNDGRPVYINSITGMPYICPRPKITEEEYNAL